MNPQEQQLFLMSRTLSAFQVSCLNVNNDWWVGGVGCCWPRTGQSDPRSESSCHYMCHAFCCSSIWSPLIFEWLNWQSVDHRRRKFPNLKRDLCRTMACFMNGLCSSIWHTWNTRRIIFGTKATDWVWKYLYIYFTCEGTMPSQWPVIKEQDAHFNPKWSQRRLTARSSWRQNVYSLFLKAFTGSRKRLNKSKLQISASHGDVTPNPVICSANKCPPLKCKADGESPVSPHVPSH